jgi:prophage regulatory protein
VLLSSRRWGITRKVDRVDRELVSARDLEELTGTKVSTWHYWAQIGEGPESFRMGRRRVWRLSVVEEWIREQEKRGTEIAS